VEHHTAADKKTLNPKWGGAKATFLFEFPCWQECRDAEWRLEVWAHHSITANHLIGAGDLLSAVLDAGDAWRRAPGAHMEPMETVVKIKAADKGAPDDGTITLRIRCKGFFSEK
jgi:hypothetical protein